MVLWMMLTIYLCSIFAWLLLAQLWRLLRNIQAGRVFEEENVRILRAVSWCCVGAGLVCLGSTFWYLPFAAVAVAAARPAHSAVRAASRPRPARTVSRSVRNFRR